jgi:hypothetical protein
MKKFSDLAETDEEGLPVLMAAWHDLWDHDDARRPGSRDRGGGARAPQPPKSLIGTAYRPVEADVAAVAIASSATAMA